MSLVEIINTKDQQTILAAIRSASEAEIRKETNDSTPLRAAAERGNTDAMKACVGRGADIRDALRVVYTEFDSGGKVRKVLQCMFDCGFDLFSIDKDTGITHLASLLTHYHPGNNAHFSHEVLEMVVKKAKEKNPQETQRILNLVALKGVKTALDNALAHPLLLVDKFGALSSAGVKQGDAFSLLSAYKNSTQKTSSASLQSPPANNERSLRAKL